MLALSLAIAALASQDDAVQLSRHFAKGEKDQYLVESHLQTQDRPKGLETWIPTDFDLNYKFTSEVVDLLPDGVAQIHYRRPTVSRIYGETYDAPSKTVVNNVNYDFMLRVSSANEILGLQEQGKARASAQWMFAGTVGNRNPEDIVSRFIDDVIRMSVFFGPFESALDFSPKLPLGPVYLGESWKRTVGYQPQKIEGKSQLAIQRLDYTYTYLGKKTSEGKTVMRIVSALKFDTDLAAYINQYAQADTGLEKLPIHLAAKIDYDLDPKTLRTIAIRAASDGGFQIYLSSNPEVIEHETTLKGTTTVRLIGLRN